MSLVSLKAGSKLQKLIVSDSKIDPIPQVYRSKKLTSFTHYETVPPVLRPSLNLI